MGSNAPRNMLAIGFWFAPSPGTLKANRAKPPFLLTPLNCSSPRSPPNFEYTAFWASKDSGATPSRYSLTAPNVLSSLVMRTQNKLSPGITPISPIGLGLA